MTREEKKKAIDALKISVPVMAVTQEEFNDYIQTLNQVMDWLEQEPKTGHWIIYDVHGHKACKCSECDKDVGYPCNDKYCPKCGCLMIKPQESEVNNG